MIIIGETEIPAHSSMLWVQGEYFENGENLPSLLNRPQQLLSSVVGGTFVVTLLFR